MATEDGSSTYTRGFIRQGEGEGGGGGYSPPPPPPFKILVQFYNLASFPGLPCTTKQSEGVKSTHSLMQEGLKLTIPKPQLNNWL